MGLVNDFEFLLLYFIRSIPSFSITQLIIRKHRPVGEFKYCNIHYSIQVVYIHLKCKKGRGGPKPLINKGGFHFIY